VFLPFISGEKCLDIINIARLMYIIKDTRINVLLTFLLDLSRFAHVVLTFSLGSPHHRDSLVILCNIDNIRDNRLL
jgi:hypothetical protein